MLRTANRPHGDGADRSGARHHDRVAGDYAGTLWLTHETNFITGGLTLLTAFLYVACVHAAEAALRRWRRLSGRFREHAAAAWGGPPPGVIGGRVWRCLQFSSCGSFPHFMSIAWLYREDYARAGFAYCRWRSRMAGRTALEALHLRGAHDFRRACCRSGCTWMGRFMRESRWHWGWCTSATTIRFTGDRASAE